MSANVRSHELRVQSSEECAGVRRTRREGEPAWSALLLCPQARLRHRAASSRGSLPSDRTPTKMTAAMETASATPPAVLPADPGWRMGSRGPWGPNAT